MEVEITIRKVISGKKWLKINPQLRLNLDSFLYIQHGHTCAMLVPLTPWVPLENHSVRPNVDHVRRQPCAE